MQITIHNYETILIDYFDGNLNALEVAEVLLFLEQHHEIKKEFEAFGVLPKADNLIVETAFKSQLKKFNNNETLAKKSFNELIVSQMEGDCSASENELINEIIEGNQSLITLKNSFQFTKLTPDLNVIYPQKAALKRKEAVVFYFNKKFAAAAALLLLSALVFLVYRNANKKIAAVELAVLKNQVAPSHVILHQRELKAKTKNIAIVKARNVVLQQQQNKVKQLIFPSNKNTNLELLKADTPQRELIDLTSIGIRPMITIENNILTNGLAQGLINTDVRYEANINDNENDFLTVGDWMKKKLIARGKNNLIENEKPISKDELALDPLTVASVGAGILEKTTGKKVFLSRSYNKSGSVKSYTFAAGNFKFERIK